MDKLRHVLFASAPHALCKKERVLFGGVTCPSVVSACVRDVVFDVTDNEAKYKNSFVICKKANKKETRGGFFSPALQSIGRAQDLDSRRFCDVRSGAGMSLSLDYRCLSSLVGSVFIFGLDETVFTGHRFS